MADLFTKRNIIIALSLGIVVLALVPGIKLIQEQQQLKSRAEEGGMPFDRYFTCSDYNVSPGTRPEACIFGIINPSGKKNCTGKITITSTSDEVTCFARCNLDSSTCQNLTAGDYCASKGRAGNTTCVNILSNCTQSKYETCYNVFSASSFYCSEKGYGTDCTDSVANCVFDSGTLNFDNADTYQQCRNDFIGIQQITLSPNPSPSPSPTPTHPSRTTPPAGGYPTPGRGGTPGETPAPSVEPGEKEIESIKINGLELDLEGSSLTIHLSESDTIPVEIKYTDGSVRTEAITFNYNPAGDRKSPAPGSSRPPAPSSAPAASLPPGSQCDIAGKQNPSVGDACAACIVNNNGGADGLIRSIRGSCTVSNVGKSDKEMVNYWCNGGLGDGASQDCRVKKTACGTACGFPAVSPSPTPTPTPSAPPAAPPGQPTLSASCPTGSTTPTLTWTAVPGAVSYDVRVDNHKGTASFTRKDCGPHSVCVNNYTSASLTFQGSSDGDYRAWVQAIGPNRTAGGVSNTVAFQCVPRVPPPTPPSSPSPSPSPSPISLTCDFNNDGKYDDKDFKIWSDEFTGQRRGLRADCNGDLKVDLVDFNLWRDQKIERE